MATPSQVLKAAEEAERIYRETYLGVDKVDDNQDVNQDNSGDQNDVKGDDNIVVKSNGDDADNNQNVIPPTQEDWKHKYQVLQGMYNKDMAEVKDKLNAALQRIDSLVKKPDESALDKESAPIENDLIKRLENDPDIMYMKNMYPDVWKGIVKVTTEVAGVAKNASDGVAKVIDRVTEQSKVIEKSERDKFYDRLDYSVPDWEKINVSQGFADWLNEAVPYTGKTKRELLHDAYSRLDHVTVSKMFGDYKAGLEVDGNKKVKAIDDTRDVIPNRSSTKKPDSIRGKSNTEVQRISQHDIAKFYEDVQRGKYNGRDKERREMESKIEKALVEGRII